jgi:DNA-binding CsgD family transcriptional regulator
MRQTPEHLLNAVGRLIETAHSADFGKAVVELFSELIPGSIIAFDEIHEASGTYRIHHSVPLDPQGTHQFLTRLREVYTQNPIHAYIQSGGRETVMDIRDLATRRQIHKTDFYQDIFKPFQIEHQVAVRLERAGWITTLTLNRDAPISRESRRFLNLLAPHLAAVHRIACDFSRLRDLAQIRPPETLSLTPREAEVFHWLREGKRNAEIAAILHCSPRTVEKHVEGILRKTGTETRSAAIRSL